MKFKLVIYISENFKPSFSNNITLVGGGSNNDIDYELDIEALNGKLNLYSKLKKVNFFYLTS